jgi:putative PIN family toxin of toxin-antitoxin system
MSAGAVFDCMIFLQAAARDPSPARACFQLVEDGKLSLYISPAVLEEVKDVLSRHVLRRKFATLTPTWVEKFVRQVEEHAILVGDVPNVFSYPRDPDDEPYVNLAIVAGARYLVSRDNDLLDLMNEATPEGQAFRHQYPDLKILDPAALLRELAAGEQQAPEAPDDPGGHPSNPP